MSETVALDVSDLEVVTHIWIDPNVLFFFLSCIVARRLERQRKKELADPIRQLAANIAACKVPIPMAPCGIKVAPGEIVILENDHEIQEGGSHFDYRHGYPEGKYFRYSYEDTECNGKPVRVVRITPQNYEVD